MTDQALKGYDALGKHYGFYCNFKAQAWPTYKAGVYKWIGCQDDDQLLLAILERGWDDAIIEGREAIQEQAPRYEDEAKDDAEREVRVQEMQKHRKLAGEFPELMSKLQKSLARMFLRTLGQSAASYVINAYDPHEIWTKLRTRFEGAGAPTSISIYNSISTTRFTQGSVADHIDVLEKLFQLLADKREPLSETYKCHTLLNSVKHRAELKTWITNENAQMATIGYFPDWVAMTTRLLSLAQLETPTKQTPVVYFNGLETKSIRKPPSQKPKAKQSTTCYNCQKAGHFSWECRGKCTLCSPNQDGHSRASCPNQSGSPSNRNKFKKKSPKRKPNAGSDATPPGDDQKDSTGFVAYSYMLSSFTGPKIKTERTFKKKRGGVINEVILSASTALNPSPAAETTPQDDAGDYEINDGKTGQGGRKCPPLMGCTPSPHHPTNCSPTPTHSSRIVVRRRGFVKTISTVPQGSHISFLNAAGEHIKSFLDSGSSVDLLRLLINPCLTYVLSMFLFVYRLLMGKFCYERLQTPVLRSVVVFC